MSGTQVPKCRVAVKGDWYSALTRYIKTQYGAGLCSEHEAAVRQLENHRSSLPLTDITEVSIEALRNYLGMLVSLELRFPVSPKDVAIQSAWLDGISGKRFQKCSVHFEKSCVLYNIGCSYAFIASIQHRGSPEGIKKACQFFQIAAGIFDTLRDYLSKHPQDMEGPDFSVTHLNMLVRMMLAQAQECFYETASRDNMSPLVVSTLAAQIAEFYQQALSLMNEEPLRSQGLPSVWIYHAQLRIQYFSAAAAFRYSMHMLAQKEYGLRVSYLQLAQDLLTNSKTKGFIKNATPEMKTNVENVTKVVSTTLASAQHDNEIVYHMTAKPFATLPPLEKREIVKILPFDWSTVRLSSDADPFYRLVPFVVHQAVSTYADQKHRFLLEQTRAFEEMNSLATSSLCSMQLPGSIQALDSAGGFPPVVVQKIQEFQKNGGAHRLRELFDMRAKIAQTNIDLYVEAIRLLDAEEEDDNNFRTQLGSSWNRQPSHMLTTGLREEGKKHQANIEHAAKSDLLVLRKFEEQQEILIKLSGQWKDIQALLPGRDAMMITKHPVVAELTQHLAVLDKVLAVREVLFAEIKEALNKDDISAKILGATEPLEVIIANEMHKHDALVQQFQENFKEQEKLLELICEANKRFVETQQRADPLIEQRQRVLQRIDTAIRLHTELTSNLNEGINFYTLLQDHLLRFKSKVSDFEHSRNLEKQELISFAASIAPPSYPGTPPSYSGGLPSYSGASSQGFAYIPPQGYGTYQPSAPPAYSAAPVASSSAFPVGSVPFGGLPQYTTSPPPYFQSPPPGYR